MILMDLLKIQLEGRYLGRDIFLFIFYSDSTAFSSTKYVRVSYKRFYVKEELRIDQLFISISIIRLYISPEN